MKMIPFGHKLAKRLLEGYDEALYVFMGHNAWQKSHNFNISRPTLCLPPYTSAFDYVWPVHGLDICLFDTGGCDKEYIDETACCLLSKGAKKVVASHYDVIFVYK